MYNEQKQIYWYSGLYLQPQHFQSIDLHHSYMLAQHIARAQPWNFGCYECEIDHGALNESILKINKLKAILPSGYYLEYPGNCTISQKHLVDSNITNGHPIRFWIALRRFDPKYPNVSDNKEKTSNTRWISTDEEQLMKDVYHNSPETGITRISYNLQIISDEEKNHMLDSELLPITRLIHENNGLTVDPTFIPPFLSVFQSDGLRGIIDDIYYSLCACAHKLEACKHTELNAISFRKNGNIVRLLMLCIFNRMLPIIESWQRENLVHPWYYFNLLCQLIGELSSFDKTPSSLISDKKQHCIIKYDHYNLFACFSSIKDHISNLLIKLSLDDNIEIPLRRVTSGIFVGNIIENSTLSNDVYIMLRSEVFRGNAKALIHTPDIKISSSDDINTIIQHALPGVAMELMECAPGGLPERMDTVWLKINVADVLWSKMQRDKNISLYWVAAPEDLYIELIIVPSSPDDHLLDGKF